MLDNKTRPAFPAHENATAGLSKREYMATAMMAAFITADNNTPETSAQAVALDAVYLADALLDELRK